MPAYRSSKGIGRTSYRIPSTTGLKAPGKLVTCARTGVLVNFSDTIVQNGHRIWIKAADKPTGDPRDGD